LNEQDAGRRRRELLSVDEAAPSFISPPHDTRRSLANRGFSRHGV